MRGALTEIRRTADDFLAEHRYEFEPFDWTVEGKTEFRRKATTELGMYLYCAEEHGRGRPWVRSHLDEIVTDKRFCELLRRYPGRFTQNAFPAIPFYSTDDLPDATERAVGQVLQSPRLWTRERKPSELVDLLVQCRLLGYTGHDRHLPSVLETSNLAHTPDLVAADVGDIYDFTHNVFLPTGWGSARPSLLETPLPYDLQSTITGLLLRAIAMGNADATMELLIAGVLQRQLEKSLIEYTVEWLRNEKMTESHVVGPVLFSTEELPDEWGSSTRTWAKHYHANVQAGIMVEVLSGTLSVRKYHPNDVSLSSAEYRNLVSLGRALNQLHSYRLESAAETLAAIDDETLERFPAITERITTFIERQRAGDSFGNWVDERRLFELRTGNTADFERELVEQVAETCENVLASLPSVSSDPSE